MRLLLKMPIYAYRWLISAVASGQLPLPADLLDLRS